MTSVAAEMFHREQESRCMCVRCGTCNGDGTILDQFDYIGDGLTTCEDCEGSGVTEECDRCMERREQDRDE